MKVLIDGKWQEFEVEFGEVHPDGGASVHSSKLRDACMLSVCDSIGSLVVVYDDDGAALLCFRNDDDESQIVASHLARLTPLELYTYRFLTI